MRSQIKKNKCLSQTSKENLNRIYRLSSLLKKDWNLAISNGRKSKRYVNDIKNPQNDNKVLMKSTIDSSLLWAEKLLHPKLYNFFNNHQMTPDASEQHITKEILKELNNLSMLQKHYLWSFLVHKVSVLSPFLKILSAFYQLFFKYGILLSDVPVEVFFDRVRLMVEEDTPEDFFAASFIQSLKKTLYGNNSLPLPLHNERPGKEDQSIRIRRQQLIEHITWKGTLDNLEEFLVQRHTQSLGARPHLKSIWSTWVTPIAEAIQNHVRQRAGRIIIGRNIIMQRQYEPNSILPTQLSPNLMAVLTIQTVLQTVFIQTMQSAHRQDMYQRLKASIENGNIAEVDDGFDGNLHIPSMQRQKDQMFQGGLTAPVVRVSLAIGKSIDSELTASTRLPAVHRPPEESSIEVRSDLSDTTHDCNSNIQTKIGSLLLNMLVKNCFVEVSLKSGVDEIQALCDRDSNRQTLKEKASLFAQQCASQMQGKNVVVNDDPTAATAAKTTSKEVLWLTMEEAVKRQDSSFIVASLTHPKEKAFVRAFRHSIQRFGIQKIGVVHLPQITIDALLERETLGFENALHLPYAPMICPPLNWKYQLNKGAYYMHQPQMMRQFIDREIFTRQYKKSEGFQHVSETLTSLGRQPWKVNAKVLEIVEDLWNRQYQIKGLPSKGQYSIPYPSKDTIDVENTLLFKEWLRGKKQDDLEKRQYRSLLTSFLTQLKVAQQFKDVPEIYFPHSIDFRGRAYPVPPILNHQIGDLSRGLLQFAEKKALGKDGLKWIKIHLAGLFGHDKIPFDERIEWTNQNLNQMLKIAKNPLDIDLLPFWANHDKPIQILAYCLELEAILSSSDTEAFVTGMPIHQDGTCNGLQHYAALGRDIQGAQSVNILPSETPQDVYVAVLNECKRKVEYLTQQIQHPHQEIAKIIIDNNILERKVVKQTVMTICYGVTTMGAYQQIKKQLMDKYSTTTFDSDTINQASSVISQSILRAVDTIFKNAMGLKRWLDVVSLACTKSGIPVSWISPCGLPCIQPYFKDISARIKSPLQRISLTKVIDFSKLDNRKQSLGLPPNFIHSLDASHMLMTSKKCFEKGHRVFSLGMSFAAVHDSFWTHPCDVDTMNTILREEFVAIHSLPILINFYDSLRRRGILKEDSQKPPGVGNLDISEVLRSRYFFS